MKMLPGQNKRLHALLQQLNLMEDKKALVWYFSAQRTESARELEQHQAQALIEHLAASIGQPGYAPPRGVVLAAQQPIPTAPPTAATPKRRGRPLGTSKLKSDRPAPDAEAANRMRRKIFAIGRAIGWLSGDTDADRAMNRAKLNSFLERKSYLKKPLNQYAPAELPKLVAQFELIEKNIKKSADNREAGDAVAALLAELALPAAPARPTSPRKPAA